MRERVEARKTAGRSPRISGPRGIFCFFATFTLKVESRVS